MNPLAAIENLDGMVLVAVIAGLLLIEETGIPLLFAPGDLLLTIGGIAIATGRVHPWLLVPAAAGAMLTGAMLGREVFAMIGWQRASRLARQFPGERALQRVAGMLHNGGWRAVFIVRLIPGLRIHTSQVAGLSQMSRRTFFAGLLAATTVYLAAFVGLGAALGQPILQLIHQGEGDAVVGGVLLAGTAVALLLLRRRVQSAATSLDLAQWRQAFRWRRPTALVLSLIPVAIGLNYAGHALAKAAGLPLFFDSTGTILAGLLAGPWIGALSGFLTNLISASTVDPIAAPYSIVSLLLGFTAGIAGYLAWPRRRIGWLALAVLCFAIASVGSTPLNLAIYQGQSGVWLGDGVDRLLIASHFPAMVAAYFGEAAVDVPDKLLTVFLVFLMYRALPRERSFESRPRRARAAAIGRVVSAIAIMLMVAGCGANASDSGPASPSAPSAPSVAALTAVADQVFPLHAKYGYYVECINFKENGAAQPGGNDYSACPITETLRARMVQTQAHFCPCEQNPSIDRAIKVTPKPGGGIASVLLYRGNVKAELVIVSVNRRLLVNDLPAKGDADSGTSTPISFQEKPASTPSTTTPPSPPSGPGSRTLNVPWYHQAFELSCEEASLRMALAYEGIATTDAAVLDIIGSDLRPAYFDNTGLHWGDPFATFVGNVNGSEIALTGYGTYYPTIAHAAKVLGGQVLRAGQGIPAADVYGAVLDGHPVVVWVTYKWVIQHRKDYVAFDGRTVTYAGPGEHAVVVVGVTPTRVLINNPWSGPEWVAKATFEAVYATYDNMAVILA